MSTDQVNPSRSGYALEEIEVADPSSLARTVGGTAIGNFTEWYDFGVYSYVVPFLSAAFFPSSGLAQIATFAGLTVSFLIRPIGGIFWGVLGDRIGRKGVLAATVLLMALGTFLLGILPGYAAIGIAAPILLFVSRAIQGFSTGGEYVGAMTFLAEHAPDRQRGRICSYLPVGTLSGYIFGALLVTVLHATLSHEAMSSWGWRIPFLVAAPLGIAGLFLRLKLEETPAYEKQSDEDRMGSRDRMQQFKDTVLAQWRPLLVCAGLVMAFNVTNYMLTGYMPTYLSSVLGVPSTPGLLIVIAVMVVIALLVVFLGRLSDRVGRKPVMIAGCLLLIAGSFPAFWLILQGGYFVMFAGAMLVGLMLVCFMSTEPSTLPTLFPTSVRYGATSVAFNLSVSIFGGTTPLVAAALIHRTGDHLVPVYMLIVAGVVGVISVYFTPEPAGRALKGSSPTAASDEEAREIAANASA